MRAYSKSWQLKSILVVLIASLVYGCQSPDIEDTSPQTLINQNLEKEVQNGRFVFSSRESLNNTIMDLQSQEIKDIEEDFEKLYEKGFRSYKPIISPSNEDLQQKFSANSRIWEDSSVETEEERIIADPFFGSLVLRMLMNFTWELTGFC